MKLALTWKMLIQRYPCMLKYKRHHSRYRHCGKSTDTKAKPNLETKPLLYSWLWKILSIQNNPNFERLKISVLWQRLLYSRCILNLKSILRTEAFNGGMCFFVLCNPSFAGFSTKSSGKIELFLLQYFTNMRPANDDWNAVRYFFVSTL